MTLAHDECPRGEPPADRGPTPCDTRVILEVPIAQIDYDNLIRLLTQWTAEEGRAHSVVFANVHVVTEAHRNPAYHAALADADLVAPDGMPLVWASRLLGGSLTDRCYGPIAMQRVIGHSGQTGWRHAFYGSTEPVLSALAKAVKTRWPAVPVVGTLAAPFGPFDDAIEQSNIEAINRTGADLLWVGLGCPRQELWMQRYRHLLRCRVVLAVGAGFDFLAGTKPQAPAWMQRRGLEWVHRLSHEPRRLGRRYLARNPYFVWRFALQLLARTRATNKAATAIKR